MTSPRSRGAPSAGAPRLAITGASGFLGSALVAQLRGDGATVHRLRRDRQIDPPDIVWNPATGALDAAALEGVDAVINLAGEALAQRWTVSRKRRIRDSRVNGTTLLAQTLASLRRPPRVLLSGSAIGVYGDRGDEALDEQSATGSGFLASVAEEWERATEPARVAGIRVVLLRTGVVLHAAGGALAKMLLPFKLGLGGRIGSGRQCMSWIARVDWVRATRYLLENETLAGPVNLVAPHPVPNAEFTRTLARVLGRPALLPLPAVAVDLLLGEMGRATLLGSQRVYPRRLRDAGFEFSAPTLEEALRVAGLSAGG